jgi:DNA polymerase-3 subunit gamma/tau
MFLSGVKQKDDNSNKNTITEKFDKNIVSDFKNDTINQIKNVTQEKKIKPEIKTEVKAEEKNIINTFEQLLSICSEKKELKLKYELEKNVNLVSFEKNRIEISFNDNLDKNFVKDLSLRLYEWTDQRWIITLSKIKGEKSIKEQVENKKKDQIEAAKNTKLYKDVLEKFSDAKLIEITNEISEKE